MMENIGWRSLESRQFYVMKLSIITINYNNAHGLQRTLDSVARQFFADLEYIVVDGNSKDDSLKCLSVFEEKWNAGISRVGTFRWISEPDTGIYNAMNKGIRMAKGDYCLFLNSGDYLANKDTLQQVFSDFPFGKDIVYGHQWNEVDGRLQEEICIDVAYITFDTLRNAHIPHQSTFIRREALNALGGYSEEYRIISDWAFVMKGLFKLDYTIARIPQFVSVYDTTGISSTADKAPQWQQRADFLHKEFPLFMPDYERWDRLNKNVYMKLIRWLRQCKHILHI